MLDRVVRDCRFSETSQHLFRAVLIAPPEGEKAINSHGDGVNSLFDLVSFPVIELTAQLTTYEDSQIARSTDEKLCIVDIMFLGETVKERHPQNIRFLMGCTRTALS